MDLCLKILDKKILNNSLTFNLSARITSISILYNYVFLLDFFYITKVFTIFLFYIHSRKLIGMHKTFVSQNFSLIGFSKFRFRFSNSCVLDSMYLVFSYGEPESVSVVDRPLGNEIFLSSEIYIN